MLHYVAPAQTLHLIFVSFLSCLLFVTEPVTIYSWVYLRVLWQLNSQFYIPGLLLQLKLKKVLLNVKTNFTTGKLFSIILDTVFCFEDWLYLTSLSFCWRKPPVFPITQAASTQAPSQELRSSLTPFSFGERTLIYSIYLASSSLLWTDVASPCYNLSWYPSLHNTYCSFHLHTYLDKCTYSLFPWG